MMEAPKNYAEMVESAERAVSAVKDPELRRVAFQKILEDLLSGGHHSAGQQGRRPGGATQKVSKNLSKSHSSGTTAYILELFDEGFFKKQQTITSVKAELENRGHHIPLTSLSGPLQRLCQQKTLRRQRIKVGAKRQTYGYSNW